MPRTSGLRTTSTVMACLALAACAASPTPAGGSAPPPSAPAVAPSPTPAGASLDPTSPAPAPSQAPSSAAGSELVALPESVLRPIGTLVYRRISEDDTPPAEMTAFARQSQGAVTGFLTRAAVDPGSGAVVAVVQVIRLSPDLPAEHLGEVPALLVEGYTGGAETTEETIAGRPAFVAPTVRDQELSVIAVVDDRDIVLFTSSGLEVLRQLVDAYYS